MPIQLPSAPQPVSTLLIRSLQLYWTTFWRVFLMALLVAITAFTPRLVSLYLGEDIMVTMPLYSPHRLWFVLIDLVCLTFFTAILWRMQCALRRAHESLGDDVKVALKKVPLIFVAVIIQVLIISIIFISLFVGMVFLSSKKLLLTIGGLGTLLKCSIVFIEFFIALYLFFIFTFYLPLILTENQGVIASLKRSVHLVWGNWWKTLRMQITPWLAYLVCLVLVRFGAQVDIHIFFVSQQTASTFIDVGLQILIFTLFIPWFASALLVQLHDLELRKKLLPPS